MTQVNQDFFARAKACIPGGVNSPVRSFAAVGGTPFFTTHAQDCYLYDIDGNQYTDYVCSWGANIVGHANSYLIDKLSTALNNGFSFGTASVVEVEFAEQIKRLMPSIAKLRLVSSGTEAVMTALRLARGYTKKQYVIKFAGCYHGHSDSLLVAAGSGVATLATHPNTPHNYNQPSSAGVLATHVAHTLVVEYNDVDMLKAAFKAQQHDIAAVILEPFAGNMNLVRPSNEFLATLVKLCKQEESLLIFDEVMTGFRVALGGAQALLDITPDITVLGKVIGGGLPLAALGGRADVMDYLAPLGTVYQAGTLSGNPLAVSAGLATLDLITTGDFYTQLTKTTMSLTNGLAILASKYNVQFNVDAVGGMFGFYFSSTPPTNFATMQLADKTRFTQFFQLMLDAGVYFAPSMFEAGFVCSKHTAAVIDNTLAAADLAFKQISAASDEKW